MGDHLITEILKIEAEADNIVNNAKQKAGEIIANINNEIGFMKTTFENEYRQKLAELKQTILELQKSEEEHVGNEFESLKKKLLCINNKIMEDTVDLVVKYIYES